MSNVYEPVRSMPTANLVIALQKLAKNVSHFKPGYRVELLTEAADRLNTQRQRERARFALREATLMREVIEALKLASDALRSTPMQAFRTPEGQAKRARALDAVQAVLRENP